MRTPKNQSSLVLPPGVLPGYKSLETILKLALESFHEDHRDGVNCFETNLTADPLHFIDEVYKQDFVLGF